ncbi:hypothetical protein ACFQ14_10755 [Pseudahrensia aquimaris]|uniref:Uncharacterized protein n=1 Tax=Pseudahrensia aquimaris TaxID=744461 RepID=A0ABW3FJE4_9HYPH
MSANKIRVIIFEESTQWVAQGLEHDICVQAENLDDLYGRFEVAVRLESEEQGGLDRIPSAPKHFHNLWDKKSGGFLPSNNGGGKYDFGMAA